MSKREVEPPFFEQGGKVYCITPLGGKMLVKRDTEEQSKGGIVIPDSAKMTSLTGVVIKVGPDVSYCKEGERVFFARFTGKLIAEDLPTEVKPQFAEVMVCTEDDILGHVVEVG